jgi:hypothetical protein
MSGTALPSLPSPKQGALQGYPHSSLCGAHCSVAALSFAPRSPRE